MNKLLIALIAGGFANVAAAQTAAPAAAPMAAPATKAEVNKEKAKTVDAVTTKGGESSTGGPETAAQAKKDTAVSKAMPKATTAEKAADVKGAATPKAATP